MDIERLKLLEHKQYSRYEEHRPEAPAQLEMLVKMVQLHADCEDDFEDAIDELEEGPARYTSIEELSEEHLFDELTFLLCGTEIDGYEIYTIGAEEPELYVARSYGSNSVGAVFRAGDAKHPILLDSDLMFGGIDAPADPALAQKLADLCREA